MATVTTAQAGNWNDVATWTGAALPLPADTAELNHNVVFNTSDQITVLDSDGGELQFKAGYTLTFTDSVGCGVIIRDTAGSGICHSAVTPPTAASTSAITSASTSPTNHWTWTVEDIAGEDTRELNLDFVELTGGGTYLGNDEYEIDFNEGGATDPIITNATPLARSPIIDEHPIEGRAQSRIFARGASAGIVMITGRFAWDDWQWLTIKQMLEDGSRLAFFSRYVSLPKCRIASEPQFTPRQAWIDFTLILKEDD